MQDAKLFLLLGKYKNQKILIFSRFQVSVKKYEEEERSDLELAERIKIEKRNMDGGMSYS
jgi:hypothetical protein